MVENMCALMQEVQHSCFAMLEAALFLDTHPTDQKALAAFREYRDRYQAAAAKYNECVGPLTYSAAKAESKWDWGCTPWPWEG